MMFSSSFLKHVSIWKQDMVSLSSDLSVSSSEICSRTALNSRISSVNFHVEQQGEHIQQRPLFLYVSAAVNVCEALSSLRKKREMNTFRIFLIRI